MRAVWVRDPSCVGFWAQRFCIGHCPPALSVARASKAAALHMLAGIIKPLTVTVHDSTRMLSLAILLPFHVPDFYRPRSSATTTLNEFPCDARRPADVHVQHQNGRGQLRLPGIDGVCWQRRRVSEAVCLSCSLSSKRGLLVVSVSVIEHQPHKAGQRVLQTCFACNDATRHEALQWPYCLLC